MTAFSRERVSFVPTAFFAEFLAGARGVDGEAHRPRRGHAKHSLIHSDIAPDLPSRGR